MGDRLTHLTTRRAWPVLVVSLLVVVLAALVGSGVVGKLKGGGFDDPASESSRAAVELTLTLHRPETNLLLLVTAPDGARVGVDDARVAAAGRGAARRLDEQPDVSVLGDYWSAPKAASAGLRSTDGRSALVVAHVDGDESTVRGRSAELQRQFTATTADGVRIATGGFGQANADVTGQVTKDLARAESLAIPLTLALLVVVFGSVVAGLLPLLIGGIAIAGASRGCP